MTSQPKVFISYRRDEPGNYAGHIYRAVRDYFGPDSVFIDVVTLAPGTTWVEEITNAVEESRALLVVIGPQWATLTKPGSSVQDFVELEVELALRRPETVVIPVLVGGAELPAAAELPGSLRKLTERQALVLDDRYWDQGIEDLRRALERSGLRRTAPPRPPEPDRTHEQHPTLEQPATQEHRPAQPERDPASLGALVLQGVLLAFAVGLVANWLVTELMPAPDDQATKEAAIAVSVARRTAAWAIVGAALALWLALSAGRARGAPGRALAGLFLGALAGAIGGTVDALPDITEQELGGWVEPAALGATGALVGALLGGSWQPHHAAYGFMAGGVVGVLVQLAFESPANPGEAAIRVTLIAGLVLAALALLALASETAARSRPAGTGLPPPPAH